MARRRTLHPDFFHDEELVALDPLHRLLFAGLWCWADREGRLLDKPLKLKMQILPADAIDVDAALQDMQAAKLITRYEVDGQKYLLVNSFKRFQWPHPREAASVIPPPPGYPPAMHDDKATGKPPAEASCMAVEPLGIFGVPGSSGSSEYRGDGADAPAPAVDDDALADAADAGAEPVDASADRHRVPTLLPSAEIWSASVPQCLLSLYAETLRPGETTWRRVAFWTRKLSTHARARLREHPERAWWMDVFKRAAASPFLTGTNDRKWHADFEWFVKSSDNARKVIEGKYDPPPTTPRAARLAVVNAPLTTWTHALRGLYEDGKIEQASYRRWATVAIARAGEVLHVRTLKSWASEMTPLADMLAEAVREIDPSISAVEIGELKEPTTP